MMINSMKLKQRKLRKRGRSTPQEVVLEKKKSSQMTMRKKRPQRMRRRLLS